MTTREEHDMITELIDTTENIITDLEEENNKLLAQIDTIYDKLNECISVLMTIEDNLYNGYEQLEEKVKNKHSEINIDWLDIELKLCCHDVLYKPMTQIVNTLKYIVKGQP